MITNSRLAVPGNPVYAATPFSLIDNTGAAEELLETSMLIGPLKVAVPCFQATVNRNCH